MSDGATAPEIDKLVERLLSDTGATIPVRVEEILRLLAVDLSYYNLDDPGLIRRFVHRAKIKGQHVADQLLSAVKKIKLHALWCPDEDQILVDERLPIPKKRWATFHDATHRLLPWHREFFRWDTAQTLDPAYQEMLEAEANYGASALMFCGHKFTLAARDTVPSWRGVQTLSRRFGTSLTTTLRRYVTHGHDRPMAALISMPRWMPSADETVSRYRHAEYSKAFRVEFGSVAPQLLGALVDANTHFARGGVIGDFAA